MVGQVEWQIAGIASEISCCTVGTGAGSEGFSSSFEVPRKGVPTYAGGWS